MDLLCFCSVLCLLCLCARLFICALWPPAGKGLTSWLSFVVSYCEFVTFPSIGILGQVWYLIVSTPDLCTLTYFQIKTEGCQMILICDVHIVFGKIYLYNIIPLIWLNFAETRSVKI